MKIKISVQELEILILILASPCFLFPGGARGWFALLLIPACYFFTRMSDPSEPKVTPFDRVMCILLGSLFLSIWVTPDLSNSMPKMVGLLFGIVFFYALVGWARKTPDRVRGAVTIYAVIGGAFSLVSIFGTAWLFKVPALSKLVTFMPRLFGGLPGAEEGFHPNAVAGTVIWFIPLQVSMLVGGFRLPRRDSDRAHLARFRHPGTQAVLLILTGGILILAQSRGAWFALSIALGAFAIFTWRALRVPAAILMLCAICLPFYYLTEAQNAAKAYLGNDVGLSFAGRREIWRCAFEAFQEYPLSGIGMNSFRNIMPVMFPSVSLPQTFDVAHAHNQLLQVGLDLGIGGLVAYVALLIGAGTLSVRVFQNTKEGWEQDAILGLGMGLLAHFIFGFGDAIALGAKVGIVFWVTLALIVSLFLVISERQTAEKGESINA